MWTFEHTESTTATPEQLWEHYADPSLWPRWDKELAAVEMVGPMVTGARATVRPTSGPTTTITFTEVVVGTGFTDVSRLPLGLTTFIFDHRVTRTRTGCRFVHEIRVGGPLSPVLGRAVGRRLAAGLPSAMRSLALLAESGSAETR